MKKRKEVKLTEEQMKKEEEKRMMALQKETYNMKKFMKEFNKASDEVGLKNMISKHQMGKKYML